MEKVAVLGLGIVGSRVRGRLLEAGYPVACWSRTRRGLEGEKDSPEQAVADAGLVSIYLKDVPMVREVFARAKAGLKKGALVMNHSTIDLPTTLWLAEQCAAKGCDFIDAPFTGSKDASAAGQLLYYTGGDEELVEKVSDFLAVSSKGRIHCGEIGAATVTKLGTNLISACTVQAMSEALAIAVRHGVNPAVFTEAAIRNGSGSPLMAMKYPGMLAGDFEPHFTMANMWKDSLYALALAESAGVDLPAMSAVSTRMGEMCGSGSADLDFSALVKAYE
ncbi:NAD(P)-dependent oxidoreductase [Akkermansiaceae bacterium]|nr:NAD(P)-dependent oxidoreductase [Akkermansiaceae bacterium]